MREQQDSRLIGEWVIDLTDSDAVKNYGLVSMKFNENGQLIYRIHLVGETKISILTYRIHNGLLITDQPSAPKEEQTGYSITPEDKLILDYGSSTSRFIRGTIVQQRPPTV